MGAFCVVNTQGRNDVSVRGSMESHRQTGSPNDSVAGVWNVRRRREGSGDRERGPSTRAQGSRMCDASASALLSSTCQMG